MGSSNVETKSLGKEWADTAANSRLAHLLATKKSTDQKFLEEIAKGNVPGYKDFEIRCEAIKKLENQYVLEKIAVENKYRTVRRTAIGKLSKESLIKIILDRMNRKSAISRFVALDKIHKSTKCSGKNYNN